MRQLTADTIIRVRKTRPPLTGDTRIRLSNIKGLKVDDPPKIAGRYTATRQVQSRLQPLKQESDSD